MLLCLHLFFQFVLHVFFIFLPCFISLVIVTASKPNDICSNIFRNILWDNTGDVVAIPIEAGDVHEFHAVTAKIVLQSKCFIAFCIFCSVNQIKKDGVDYDWWSSKTPPILIWLAEQKILNLNERFDNWVAKQEFSQSQGCIESLVFKLKAW